MVFDYLYKFFPPRCLPGFYQCRNRREANPVYGARGKTSFCCLSPLNARKYHIWDQGNKVLVEK